MKSRLSFLRPLIYTTCGLLCSLAASQAERDKALILYCGRSETLVGPLIKKFEEETQIDVRVRYGKTAELTATLLEEGTRSPADLFFAQDAGALGALAKENRLTPLPHDLLERVDKRFRSKHGNWIGVSGRARVIVYNTDRLKKEDLPQTIFGFCDPTWKKRIGWAPANGSFQAFVTALRVTQGNKKARQWLTCIQANEPNVYPKNTPIVAAVGAGEIDVGFVNHYYLFRFIAEHGKQFPAKNYVLHSGDPGALVNVAGISILDSSKRKESANRFITFLLSKRSQTYFAEETHEYPLVSGVPASPNLIPLASIQAPNIDLSDLEDLEGTLQLLQELGIL
ncbi:MAG: extracellular solute-binding protein [Kiritimatiellae bacterium]|nr:extracellular solute-binding protein [Kiritimatiellia bacterium]